MAAMQSLVVRECSNISTEGLHAMAALTQLTSLDAGLTGRAVGRSASPAPRFMEDIPEALLLLSSLTGAAVLTTPLPSELLCSAHCLSKDIGCLG